MPAQNELQERFRAFVRGGALDVFEGALFVAELIDPAEDVGAARKKVEALAARVRKTASGGVDPVTALRTVLFEEEGLRGDTESYDEPANSSGMVGCHVGYHFQTFVVGCFPFSLHGHRGRAVGGRRGRGVPGAG